MSDSQTPDPISEALEERLISYVLGELSPPEKKEIESYLSTRPELTPYIKELREVMGLLGEGSPQIAAPDRLRDKILLAANSTTPSDRETRRLIFPWRKLGVGAIALLVLWLGWDNYRLRQQLALSPMQPRLVTLKSSSGVAPARGRVLVDFQTRRVMLAFQNLNPLPQGQYYQLWAITDDEIIPCGSFRVDSRNSVLEVIVAPVEEYANELFTMRLTIESSPKAIAPSQQVVMESIADV